MNVIEFSIFKKLSDEELIEKTYNKIDKLKCLLHRENNEEYWREAMMVDDMIVEIKKRNLKIDEVKLIEKILKK